MRRVLRWTAAAVGSAVAGYAACVGAAWLRYGRARRAAARRDPLLDRLMPEYDVAERHFAYIAATPDVALQAARDVDIERSPLVHAIFAARAAILGAGRDDTPRPKGLLALTRSLGWGVLAEEPGRQIVVGAVTQPWLANVVFRSLPPAAFKDFGEPGYVKIVWTLRADPAGPGHSVFRTETRAIATSPDARRRFRWYWARFSPGIIAIRRLMLMQLRRDAERRLRSASTAAAAAVL